MSLRWVFLTLLVAASAVGGASAALVVLEEEVDFDLLINIEYEEGRPLPSEVTRYDGKRVVVKGFMENSTTEGTNVFQLVTDGCGCDGNLKVYHFIEIDLGDEVTGYTPDLLTITGTMSVGEIRDDGYVMSVYRIAADKVE